MNEVKRPVNLHEAYHAHVYFDQNTEKDAAALCDSVGSQFDVSVGRFHKKLVGPHPMWSCQISFTNKQFDQVISWFDEHRLGLTIFVHGLTGNDIDDHTKYAYWLGESVKLNLSFFNI